MPTVYDFTVKGRNGTTLDLATLRGKVLLIVNTATGCGFTPQYEGMKVSRFVETSKMMSFSMAKAGIWVLNSHLKRKPVAKTLIRCQVLDSLMIYTAIS